MMLVLVNPITKAPTAFIPSEDTPRILSGPYQNCAEVSEEWVFEERKRLGVHVLVKYEEWTRNEERIAAAVAAEREACAKIAEDCRCANPDDHWLQGRNDASEEIAAAIRARETA